MRDNVAHRRIDQLEQSDHVHSMYNGQRDAMLTAMSRDIAQLQSDIDVLKKHLKVQIVTIPSQRVTMPDHSAV